MIEPRRLRDGDDLGAALLRSAGEDAPEPGARRAIAAALGLVAVPVAIAHTTAAAAASTAPAIAAPVAGSAAIAAPVAGTVATAGAAGVAAPAAAIAAKAGISVIAKLIVGVTLATGIGVGIAIERAPSTRPAIATERARGAAAPRVAPAAHPPAQVTEVAADVRAAAIVSAQPAAPAPSLDAVATPTARPRSMHDGADRVPRATTAAASTGATPAEPTSDAAITTAATAATATATARPNAAAPIHPAPAVGSPSVESTDPGGAVQPSTPRSSLTDEVAVLDAALAALRDRDAASALFLLDRYDVRFPAGALAAEAAVARIEATFAAGDKDRARALAAKFLATHRASPLAHRVRSVIEP